ncbi:MAG: hypothetical protein IJM74_02365 [Bacteroidales bacterium]|nr:hypothetical protein [Bacteroidales bacterium]
MNGERSGSNEETGDDGWQSGDGWGVVRNEGSIRMVIVRCGFVDDSD